MRSVTDGDDDKFGTIEREQHFSSSFLVSSFIRQTAYKSNVITKFCRRRFYFKTVHKFNELVHLGEHAPH